MHNSNSFLTPPGLEPQSLTKWLVSEVPLDGKLTTCHGVSYRFAASTWDVTTLPATSFTTVRVLAQLADVPPKVWRTNADRPDMILELEMVSDAKLNSMMQEAYNCWKAFAKGITERTRWMHLIGGHADIQKRMCSPLCVYRVEVRTLQDDYLARMYASGSAEIALQAELLHQVEQDIAPRNWDPIPVAFKHFLWPGKSDEIPSWAAGRYAKALAGGFHTVQTSFADAGQPTEA